MYYVERESKEINKLLEGAAGWEPIGDRVTSAISRTAGPIRGA